MARLTGGAQTQRVPGWTGGIQEATEPVYATRDAGVALRAGSNAWHENGQVERRGGSVEAAAYTAGRLLVGLVPFSQTGLLAITNDGTTHRVHAHAPDGVFALPTATTGTEADSTEDLGSGWNGAAGVPVGAELFEAVYLADDSPAATRRPLQKIALSGGSLAVTTPTYELGAGPAAAATFAGVEAFASVVFGWGYGSEDTPDEPHTLRHSFLGKDPGAADGFDPDAYATIGAQGQPIRAAKAGQGVLLVAKEAELYRISGAGAALPGWQFAIQPIDASLGAGCVNARSLVYAEGWWYGVGRDGPWRCNGAQVFPLRSNRSASWRAVGDAASAFVVHHPRRRAVLFGFDESASSLAGDGATVLWTWDLETNAWSPDQRFPRRVLAAAPVAPSGVVVPTTPSSVSQRLGGAFREDAVQLRWVNGLPTQATEVWAATSAAGNQLVATVPAGISGVVLTGLAAGTQYDVTLRHVGAVETPFTAPVAVYTRPAAPRLTGRYFNVSTGGGYAASFAFEVTTADAGLGAYVESSNAAVGAFAEDLVNLPQGATSQTVAPTPFAPTDGGTPDWYLPLVIAGYLTRPDWPEAVAYSVPAVAAIRPPFDGNLLASFGGQTFPPVPTQAVDGATWSASAITVVVTPYSGRVGTLAIEYRLFGGTTYTVADSRSVGPSTLPYTVTISGLDAGERYEVRTVLLGTAGVPVVMHTAVPVPTATIATAGSGTPVTNVTVTPPGGKAGYDIHLENTAGTFDALYSGVASTPTTYQSTVGTCGRADRYLVRARRPEWPDGLEWSPAVVLDIVNPCVIA